MITEMAELHVSVSSMPYSTIPIYFVVYIPQHLILPFILHIILYLRTVFPDISSTCHQRIY